MIALINQLTALYEKEAKLIREDLAWITRLEEMSNKKVIGILTSIRKLYNQFKTLKISTIGSFPSMESSE